MPRKKNISKKFEYFIHLYSVFQEKSNDLVMAFDNFEKYEEWASAVIKIISEH